MTQDRPIPPPPPPLAGTRPPYPAPGQFWIAIIDACAAVGLVLLILAALAIPNMLKIKKNANESAATMTMRTIQSAEVSYNSTYPNIGYACPLSVLGGEPLSGDPTAQSAQLIDPALAASGYKNGYIFTITRGNKVIIDDHETYATYRLTAVPKSVGKTGDNGYCSDENNFIMFDPAGGTNCPPLTRHHSSNLSF